jgi:hypothetical protein
VREKGGEVKARSKRFEGVTKRDWNLGSGWVKVQLD